MSDRRFSTRVVLATISYRFGNNGISQKRNKNKEKEQPQQDQDVPDESTPAPNPGGGGGQTGGAGVARSQ